MLKIIYKTYFWVIVVPIFTVLTILTALITIIGCPINEDFFSYYPGMLWSRAACFLTLCPVKVHGRENISKKRNYIFVANHQSAYDIFLIYGYLGVPIKWMMKKGLTKIPFVGTACRSAGFIIVDQKNAQTAQRSINDAENKLKLRKNRSLVVFPEGSRSRDGKLGKFKRGAYKIAVAENVPIIPITLNGPFCVMSGNSFDIKPHRLEMIIHQPVKVKGNDDNSIREAQDYTRQTIYNDLWDEFKF